MVRLNRPETPMPPPQNVRLDTLMLSEPKSANGRTLASLYLLASEPNASNN
jgi:hypothetical protein